MYKWANALGDTDNKAATKDLQRVFSFNFQTFKSGRIYKEFDNCQIWLITIELIKSTSSKSIKTQRVQNQPNLLKF